MGGSGGRKAGAKKHATTAPAIYTNPDPPTITSLWLDFGVPGASPGDQVTAYGQMYETADASGPSVGEFNLAATVTQVTGGNERRLVNIELAFYRGDVPFKAVDIAQATGNKTLNYANVAAAPTNDINMSGVVNYLAGGAILTDPIVLAVIGGTGAWTGSRGTCTITYDPALQTFKYTVTLLKF